MKRLIVRQVGKKVSVQECVRKLAWSKILKGGSDQREGCFDSMSKIGNLSAFAMNFIIMKLRP